MRIFLTVITLAMFGSTTYAADSANDDWRFRLTPYLWLAGISGDMVSDGVDVPPIEPSYNFFSVESFDGMAFMTFAARKGQWTIFSDLVYISFADTINLSLVDADWKLSGGTLEMSAGYQPESWEHTRLIFGLRGVEVDVEAALTPGPAGSDTASFVNPIVGAHYERVFDNQWGFAVRGDVGGTSSEVMVNAMLEGSYNFTDTFAATLGYRYLEIKFEDSETLLDLSAQGYFVGLRINW